MPNTRSCSVSSPFPLCPDPARFLLRDFAFILRTRSPSAFIIPVCSDICLTCYDVVLGDRKHDLKMRASVVAGPRALRRSQGPGAFCFHLELLPVFPRD